MRAAAGFGGLARACALHASRAGLVCLAAFVLASAARAEQAEAANDGFRVVTLETGGGEKALLAADLDADGRLDLAVAEQEATGVVVWRGDGRGGFAPSPAVPAGHDPSWLAAADFDADGRPDLAVVNHDTPSLTVLRGTDEGFVPGADSPLSIATAPHSHMVAAADVDRDGYVDLILDSPNRVGVFVLEGRGGGAFDAPGTGVDAGGVPYLGFAIGDIDGDGRPDLATPNTDDVGILMNRSADSIRFEPTQSIATADPFFAALGDLDGDGRAEIVIASEAADPGVSVFAASADGFEMRASFPMAAGGKTIAIGDVNGDGFGDAIVSSWNAQLLLVLGGADGWTTISPPLGGLVAPWGVAVGDVDGDGRDEIAVADGVGPRVNLYFYASEAAGPSAGGDP